VVGDSFSAGQSATAPTTIWNTPGYISKLGELLQIEDLWGRGIGGTGYLAKGSSGAAPTFRERLAADVIPYAPDVIVYQGSINDYNQTSGALTTEIQALHAATKAALPNVKMIAVSPLSSAAPTSNVRTIGGVEKAAWEALGVPYIDMIDADTGFGRVGAPDGLGSADYNRSQDAVHPTYPAGFERIAAGLAAGIAPILKATV
jgi:hypothetical protein